MKKRALAVMLAGVMVLGAQTGVWAASDTSDQKEGELTLLLTNTLIDGSGANSEEFKKVIKQYEEENPGVKITLQGASQQDIKESFQTAALPLILLLWGFCIHWKNLLQMKNSLHSIRKDLLIPANSKANIIQYHGIWTVQVFIIIKNAWMSWELMSLQRGKSFRTQ